MDYLRLFATGARTIAEMGSKYTPQHRSAGFSEQEWALLTKQGMWTAEERRAVRAVLAEAVTVSLAYAGLPAEPLPGCYVASLICALVSPVNRYLAALRAPETFDALSASGLVGESTVVPTSPQQMMAMVTLYSSGEFQGSIGVDLPKSVREAGARGSMEGVLDATV